MNRVRSLLVANRGEIACRVIRGARDMGIATVAVFSDADANAPHVRLADRAFRLGPGPASESYLSIPRLLAAAAATGADSIHPGYGFLSERAEFAQAVIDAGLTFVGPPPAAIAAMGDKARAKQRMHTAGVPCVPGYEGEDQSETRLCAEAGRIGLPLLVKAAAGGGGRGMRRVASLSELPAALASARAEALSAFGSGDLLLERLITRARHVEIQVAADEHGNVIHLCERDCSAQRRHQKVIEEAPCARLDDATRQRMGAAAVAAARSIDYRNVGTVEFLLADDGAFYFLEMNTRLQVEHPVTEAVTGIDLVALQLRIARGEPLGLAQSGVRLSGHAIEVRVYAEDPACDDLPQVGTVLALDVAGDEGLRWDGGIRRGQVLSSHYDPMLGKLIAHGRDRRQARERLCSALSRTRLLGVRHNTEFLVRVLESEAFVDATVTTDWLDGPEGRALRQSAAASAEVVALGAWLGSRGAAAPTAATFRLAHDVPSRVRVSVDGQPLTVDLRDHGEGRFDARVGETSLSLRATIERASDSGTPMELRIEDLETAVSRRVTAAFATDESLWIGDGPAVHLFEPLVRASAAKGSSDDGLLRAPTAGRVTRIDAQAGDRVRKGAPIAAIEAMKMETVLRAPFDADVVEVFVEAGAQVTPRARLALLRAAQTETSEDPTP